MAFTQTRFGFGKTDIYSEMHLGTSKQRRRTGYHMQGRITRAIDPPTHCYARHPWAVKTMVSGRPRASPIASRIRLTNSR